MKSRGNYNLLKRHSKMKGYLYVVEVLKCKEYLPYIARKRKRAAELVKANNERYSQDKYRVRKYIRRLE